MRILITYIFLLQSLFLLSQTQKAGLPNYLPTPSNNLSHIWIDTLGTTTSVGKGTYIYHSPKWYYYGKVIKANAPNDTTYSSYVFTSSGWVTINITVSYQKAEWFNTSNEEYYDYNPKTGAWASRNSFYINLLPLDNRWTGTNTFEKKTIFEKGINSDSTITSKGVNTEGSSTKEAANFKGVLSMQDTTITSNYTATGAYGRVTGDCTSNNIILTLPTPTAANLGWCYELSKKTASSFNFKITQGGFSHVIFSPNKIIRVRQKGGVWELD